MRYFSSIATAKSLSSSINASVTQMTLSGLPEGLTSYPYTLVIDPDTISEEIVTVSSLSSGTTLNITRGQDGSTATSHSAGAVVKHMVTARDLQEPQSHINTTGSVHGIADTTALATKTGTEVITNKDLTSATNTFPASLATLTGSQTLTNKTLTAPVISTISNTGTVTLPTATDTLVGRATSDTLTNKSISLGSNTVTTTKAQLNTAVTDADVAFLDGATFTGNVSVVSPTSAGSTGVRQITMSTADPTGGSDGDVWLKYV